MFKIYPLEKGITYNLDLQEESENLPGYVYTDAKEYCCILSYGHYFANPDHFTNRSEPIDFYQLFLTHAGRGKLTIGDKQYILGPDTVCLLNMKNPHRYETYGSHWDYEWVNFYAPICDRYNDIINPSGFKAYNLYGNQTIPAMMCDIRSSVVSAGWRHTIQAITRTINLLDYIAEFVLTQQQTDSDNQGDVRLAVDLIDKHYMEDITLDQMAEAAFLSKYYFSRLFTKYTGVTPVKYLNSVRLNHACSLLLSTTFSIEEISYKTGFGNSKNLIRAFQKSLNTTPAAYRQTHGLNKL